MLTAFRRYLETWPVRVFFGIMVIAFVVWGVGDVVRQIGTSTWVAKAGGETIEPPQFESAFQRGMAQAERQLPAGQDVTPALRQQVANEALQQMIGQAALTQELTRLRIVVPDAALREAVLGMPAFQGPNGQFDRAKLDAVLSSNNLSEPQFLDMVRGQIDAQQLTTAVEAGASAPALLTGKLFDFEQEKRSALMVEVPFATEAAPPALNDAELQRWYDDHPWQYRVPEFRRIKAVVLTPDSYGKTLTASDAELRAYYDAHKAEYVTPARRSVQVVVLSDAAKAKALATQWRGGAGWDAIQQAAKTAGGTAVELDDTTAQGIPEESLAKAVFAAQPGSVGEPVHTALGWDVFKVIQASPGTNQDFDAVMDQIRARVVADKAVSGIYDVANKIDDTLGTGSGLDKLPNDVGLIGVEGTLDADGNTKDGKPAPIPGPPELRNALIEAAFKMPPGQPPAQLTEVPAKSGPGSSYFAVTVEQVFPAAEKPFAEVKDQVAADWTEAARQKEAEQAATKLLTAVQGGQSLNDAATVAGLTVRQTPLVSRSSENADIPASLQHVLFGLKPKEPAMVQTPDGFVVAVADKIEVPTPKEDQAGYNRIAEVLTRSIAGDLATSFAEALRERANPRINHAVFDSFVNSQ